MEAYSELSLSAQTAYAQLLDAVMSADLGRTIADLPGSFAAKSVRGRKYWYYQYTQPSGQLRQVFVGPDTDPVRQLIAEKRSTTPPRQLGPLARAASALGCTEVTLKHARVLQRISEYGFFRAGGVLIGTHAFLAYGNMLGVRWGETARTQDVDFAHAGKNVSIALPANMEIQTAEAIDSLKMGLLPIRDLSSRSGGTYLNPRDPEFRLDFLTPMTSSESTPFDHPGLGITLQPLRFMEYSLEDIQQVALFSGDIVILANVPHPARYALHKLLIAGEREGTYATKAAKDLKQAGALLERLAEYRRSDIDSALKDLVGRGRGWTSRLTKGMHALDAVMPSLDVMALLKTDTGRKTTRKVTPSRSRKG